MFDTARLNHRTEYNGDRDGAHILGSRGRKSGKRVGGDDVIFGEDKDSVLLGVFTLEALGLVLDPLRRELKPLPMVLALAGREPKA